MKIKVSCFTMKLGGYDRENKQKVWFSFSCETEKKGGLLLFVCECDLPLASLYIISELFTELFFNSHGILIVRGSLHRVQLTASENGSQLRIMVRMIPPAVTSGRIQTILLAHTKKIKILPYDFYHKELTVIPTVLCI